MSPSRCAFSDLASRRSPCLPLSKQPPPADPAQLRACEVAADSPDVIHLRIGGREGDARLEDEQDASAEQQNNTNGAEDKRHPPGIEPRIPGKPSAWRQQRQRSKPNGQPFGGGARRSVAAIVTRPARESAFIFRITWPRCAFTVISLMPSSPPTCLFSRPETTNAMTSRSRRLSDEWRSRRLVVNNGSVKTQARRPPTAPRIP